jgi:Rod binding domain-containing protein
MGGNDMQIMRGQVAATLSSLRAAEQLSDAANGKDQEAAERMESIFAGILVKEMGRTLPQGFFGEGPGSDVFSGWMEKHLGEELGRSGALQLAERIRFDLGQEPPATEVAQ